ncbi:MAG: NINE protein [Candidatus Hydrogenedentota bacterium]
MNCRNCGASLPPDAVVCRKCGSAVEQPQQQAQPQSGQQPVNVILQTAPQQQAAPVSQAPKSKVAAGLLGIFLGALGVHRFYLGYNGLGTLMLLITLLTCGYGGILTGLWGLVEGIMILTGAINTDASGQPLQG